MEGKTLVNDIVIYSILIDSLCDAGKLIVARKLFYSLPTKGLQPNVRTYTIMPKGLCKEGLIDEESELLEKMDGNGCSPIDCTYNTIIQGLLQHNEMSKGMEGKTLVNDIVIYSILIDSLCDAGKLIVARKLFYSLPTKGLQPNVRTYTIMLKGLCKEGLIDEESELLEKMDGNGCSPIDCTYNTIIQGLLQHNEMSKAIKHLKIMVDKGFLANSTIATMLVDLLSSSQVDKNIQELLLKFVRREIFSSLLAKGLQPDVPTYNIMIKGFCKEGLIDEATNATTASMLVNLLSANLADKALQELLI
nr:pentatricopeptide repeat-containing protein At3g22470, mitochondrial-like [Quercus suber]